MGRHAGKCAAGLFSRREVAKERTHRCRRPGPPSQRQYLRRGREPEVLKATRQELLHPAWVSESLNSLAGSGPDAGFKLFRLFSGVIDEVGDIIRDFYAQITGLIHLLRPKSP